jgi:drug/metabolite transporter (DMT)-like permease
MTVLMGVFTVGAACHLPFMLGELVAGAVVHATPRAVFGLLFVAVFPSVIAIMCWNRGIAALGVNRAGFYLYLVPLFAAALAAAFLHERIALYHLVGAGLIVAGVTLSTRSPAVKGRVPAESGQAR